MNRRKLLAAAFSAMCAPVATASIVEALTPSDPAAFCIQQMQEDLAKKGRHEVWMKRGEAGVCRVTNAMVDKAIEMKCVLTGKVFEDFVVVTVTK